MARKKAKKRGKAGAKGRSGVGVRAGKKKATSRGRGAKGGAKTKKKTAGVRKKTKRAAATGALRELARSTRGAGGVVASARGATGGRGEKPLVRDLLRLYQEIGRLSRATTDLDERRRLREQQRTLGGQIDEAIAKTIREDTQEYKDAAAAMVIAERRVEEALVDLARVGSAIIAAARVIEAVAKVLGAAVGPV